MTLEPLVLIILLLFALFLLAALIIWQLIELRAMGLRDKERSLIMPVAATTVNTSTNTSEFNAVPQTELDKALKASLNPDSNTARTDGRAGRAKKQSAKNNKQSKKQATQPLKANTTPQGVSKKSSSFKTTSFGSSAQNVTQNIDAFAHFDEEGNDVLNFEGQTNSPDLGHEANLLKPPKPENDIFSTSERRDDIWLFHTAEVDPVHPAEDMTKFRQPGGITGERGGNQTSGNQASTSEASASQAASTKKSSAKIEAGPISDVTAPIQPENKLRDTLSQAGRAVGRSTRSTGFGGAMNSATSEEEKVVRMTNSSSRIAAERLIVDKEIRKTQAKAHQATKTAAISKDDSLEMPVTKKITPVEPSTPFKGSVPPIPKGVQQNLKQTFDEVTDNVSNTTKDEWKNYKNLKNTRSLVSTHSDDE